MSLLCIDFLNLISHRKILRMNDTNHNLLTLLCSNMPIKFTHNLLDTIQLLYPDLLRYIDSGAMGNTDDFFHAIHFDWYNRYFTSVGPILSI